MSDPHPDIPDGQPITVEEILATYRRSVAAGSPLDQSEVIAAHPEFADELRNIFAVTGSLPTSAMPAMDPAEAPTVLGPSAAENSAVPCAGTVVRYFGDYELLEEIARGGMGIVFRARQTSLNRIVALKMIRQSDFATEADRQRFRVEAECAANIEHPQVVPIFEIGEHEGQPYYSMRLIEGGSLAASMARGDWGGKDLATVRRATALVSSTARAVHHAHQRGVLHRDLKPGNLLLDGDGTPHVTDFGLAKVMQRDLHATQTGAILGTPAYMPPEQAQGGKGLTTAADVYSLGVILYSLLAGAPPFAGATPVETLMQVIAQPVPPLRAANPLVDRDLETICHKCLEKDPARRYPSAQALADDLDRWNCGKPIAARPLGRLETLLRWGKRNPQLALIAILTTTLLALLGISIGTGYRATILALGERDSAVRELRVRDYKGLLETSNKAVTAAETGALLQTLRAQLPADGAEDLRGWEWNFLHRQSFIATQVDLGPYTHFDLAWSPDSKLFAARRHGAIRLWSFPGADNPTLTAREKLDRRFDEFCNPDAGRILEIAAVETEVDSVIEANGNDSSRNSTGMEFHPTLAWHPDSRHLATTTRTAFEVWDVSTNLCRWRIPLKVDPRGWPFAWSQNGRRLALRDGRSKIYVYDFPGKHLLHEIPIPAEFATNTIISPQRLAWGPDDQWIALSDSFRTAFFDLNSRAVVKQWEIGILDWSRDGTRWATSAGIGVATSPNPQFKFPKPGYEPQFSPDGSLVHAGIVMETATGKISPNTRAFWLWGAWTPEGNGLVATNGWDLSLSRDLLAPPANVLIALPDPIDRLAARRDGQMVAIACRGAANTIRLYSDGGLPKGTLPGPQAAVASMDWDPAGELLAVLDGEGRVSIWDVRREKLMRTLQLPRPLAPHGGQWGVQWSSGGEWIAAGTASNIQVWETRTWKPQHSQAGVGLELLGWAFDEQTLLTLESPASLQDSSRTEPPTAGTAGLHGWNAASHRSAWRAIPDLAIRSAHLAQNGNVYVCAKDAVYELSLKEGLGGARLQKVLDSYVNGHIHVPQGAERFFLDHFDRGVVQLVDAPSNVVLMDFLRPAREVASCYANGRLWIPGDRTVRVCHGEPAHRPLLVEFAPRVRRVPDISIRERLSLFAGIGVLFPLWLIFRTPWWRKSNFSRGVSIVVLVGVAVLIWSQRGSQLRWIESQEFWTGTATPFNWRLAVFECYGTLIFGLPYFAILRTFALRQWKSLAIDILLIALLFTAFCLTFGVPPKHLEFLYVYGALAVVEWLTQVIPNLVRIVQKSLRLARESMVLFVRVPMFARRGIGSARSRGEHILQFVMLCLLIPLGESCTVLITDQSGLRLLLSWLFIAFIALNAIRMICAAIWIESHGGWAALLKEDHVKQPESLPTSPAVLDK